MFPLNPLCLESIEAFKYWEILHLKKSGFLASLEKVIRSRRLDLTAVWLQFPME